MNRVANQDDGPIGIGTRFMLTGGMMTGSVVKRLHLPVSVAGMSLPYDIVAFDAPNAFTLKGESGMLRWCDHLEFTADGDSTRLSYFAELETKRFLKNLAASIGWIVGGASLRSHAWRG